MPALNFLHSIQTQKLTSRQQTDKKNAKTAAAETPASIGK